MNKQEKLKEILFSEFDKLIEGSDIYDHRGSKWIIFTNEKRWVVEFTKEKTLWFNYYRFNEVMVLFAMDCDEDRNYIKEWYERRFIFNHKVKNGVTGVFKAYFERRNLDDTIQNGVKDIIDGLYRPVHDTIQNGVKVTKSAEYNEDAEDTIQNGVRSIFYTRQRNLSGVENTIQNGVIESLSFLDDCHLTVEDTIQNGAIYTIFPAGNRSVRVEDTIQNGVRSTAPVMDKAWSQVDNTIQNGVKITKGVNFISDDCFDDIIQNGVNVISWVHPTAIHSNQVDDIIQNGVKC